MSRIVVFDVETPNAQNDRMSAIGVAVVENGGIAEEYYTLVNPEARFDPFNVRLTGITPAMVVGQPAFPELWEQIRPLFESGLLGAHYAPFDMGVLQKCLRAYGVAWKPYASYVCTCAMGRVAYPGLYNHKLDTLCAHTGIDLDHHHAGSDSRAAAQLLLHYQSRGLDEKKFIRRYFLGGPA